MGLWGVVKKAINSNVSTPLNAILEQNNALLQEIRYNSIFAVSKIWSVTADFALFTIPYTAEDLVATSGLQQGISSGGSASIGSPTSISGSGSTYDVSAASLIAKDFTNIIAVAIDWAGAGHYSGEGVGVVSLSDAYNDAWNAGIAIKTSISTFSRVEEVLDVSVITGSKFISVHAKDSDGSYTTTETITLYKLELRTPKASVANNIISLAAGETSVTVKTPAVTKASKWTSWDFIDFGITPGAAGSAVGVDVLNGETDAVLKADVTKLTDISDLNAYNSLKLQFRMSRLNAADTSPEIYMAAIRWIE